MNQIPRLPQIEVSSENPYPITSLQELEQFTLPLAIQSSSPSINHFIYTSFHAGMSAESIQICDFTNVGIQVYSDYMTADDVPQSYFPSNKENGMTRSVQPTQENCPLSLNTSFSNNAEGTRYRSAPIEVNPLPFANAINPFFPPLNSSASSAHKRQRDTTDVEDTMPLPNNQRTDIFSEIQALVCLEVMKTRFLTPILL